MDRLTQSGQNSRIVLKKTIMKSLDGRDRLDRWLEIFVAELIGTGLILYFGCMGAFGSLTEVKPPSPMQGGLIFGFVVSSVIVAVSHISSAHMNPAVTLCAYLLGTISTLTALVYFVAECVGAILGFYLLQMTTPGTLFNDYVTNKATNNATCGFCTTVLAENVSVPHGFLIEFTATSFLIFVVCSVWDPRNANNCESNGLKFGLLIASLSIAAGPFTGASLNPARSLGPAIINNVWKNHWIYWLAPLSGSAVTTSLYKFVFMRNVQTLIPDEVSVHSRKTSLKEKKALNENSSEEKSLNIA